MENFTTAVQSLRTKARAKARVDKHKKRGLTYQFRVIWRFARRCYRVSQQFNYCIRAVKSGSVRDIQEAGRMLIEMGQISKNTELLELGQKCIYNAENIVLRRVGFNK